MVKRKKYVVLSIVSLLAANPCISSSQQQSYYELDVLTVNCDPDLGDKHYKKLLKQSDSASLLDLPPAAPPAIEDAIEFDAVNDDHSFPCKSDALSDVNVTTPKPGVAKRKPLAKPTPKADASLVPHNGFTSECFRQFLFFLFLFQQFQFKLFIFDIL